MMRNYKVYGLLFIAFMLVHVAYGQLTNIRLSGKINGLGNSTVRLLDVDLKEVQVVQAKEGSFEMKADVFSNDGRFYAIHVPDLGDLGPSMKRPTIFFIPSDKPVHITADIVDGSLVNERIVGSKLWDDFKTTYDGLASTKLLMAESDNYNKAFHAYNSVAQTEANMKELKAAGKRIDSIYKMQHKEILDLVMANPTNMTYAMIASQYCAPASNKKSIEEFLKYFEKEMVAKSYYLTKIQSNLAKYNKLEVGEYAPGFDIKDESGAVVSLADFKGKYVLIDFWASWCGPCRKEMPHVKVAQDKFKDKGFEVFAISIDRDKKAWKKALKEDNMPFVHVLDQSKEASVGSLYMVQAIPTNFLVDPTGKIIAKNLRGEELSKYLGSIL